MKARVTTLMAIVLGASVGGGCARPPEEPFVSSESVMKLPEDARRQVREILAERCGTPTAVKLLGEPGVDKGHLRRGGEVYARYCRQCHGISGDGNGPAAAYLLPRPRDYRMGIFKFTSTPYGARPLREDLSRTIRRGVAGTSMPSFHLLPDADVSAVVDHVGALARRGELEGTLAEAIEQGETLDGPTVDDLVAALVSRWERSKGQLVYPSTPMPVLNADVVAGGKAAFLTRGCSSCHGEDGRGQMATNIGVDAWKRPTKAADLTSGMLRGGTEPLDIYRHITAGINGTPMPSFGEVLKQEPETIWKITAYVLDMSNQRRRGVIPEAGLLKPLPGVEVPGAPAAATTASANVANPPPAATSRAVASSSATAPPERR